jgi:hypothetical protein
MIYGVLFFIFLYFNLNLFLFCFKLKRAIKIENDFSHSHSKCVIYDFKFSSFRVSERCVFKFNEKTFFLMSSLSWCVKLDFWFSQRWRRLVYLNLASFFQHNIIVTKTPKALDKISSKSFSFLAHHFPH